MYYYVKLSIIVFLTVSLTACTTFSLPKGIPFSGDQEGNGIKQSGNKSEIETNLIIPNDSEDQIDSDFLLEAQYFNIVKPVNGKQEIENPTNILAMVNKEYTLPENYEPADLVIPNVAFSFGEQDIPQRYLRKNAAQALEELFRLAEKDDIELLAVSGFRSYSRQQGIFNVEVDQKGEEQAQQSVALPGQSEHQTGLAMDVTSRSVNLEITEEFGQSIEGKWVKENAHRAGFIIRYPDGKNNLTGYQYEPWHLRYIGKEHAEIIYNKKITLEEFFENVKKI